MEIQTCKFVSATELVPREWDDWFWETIGDNAPFSWGDNNRSLVAACDFARHCGNRMDDSRETQAFLDRVRSLGDMYIDLET